MQDFEFLAGMFGIMLGLIFAEIAVRSADAIDGKRERPIGWLTPMLAAFIVCDINYGWLWLWSQRDVLLVSWPVVFTSAIVGMSYFFAAAMIFPRSPASWPSLDTHYWARKRWVISVLLAADLFILILSLRVALPQWNDGWFYFYQLSYFLPLAALLFTKRKRLDIALLGWLLFQYAYQAADVLPNSQWGDQVRINGTVPAAPPTIAPR